MLHASLSFSSVFGKLHEVWETLMGHFCLGECCEGHTSNDIWALEISLYGEKSTQNWVAGYQKWILEELGEGRGAMIKNTL